MHAWVLSRFSHVWLIEIPWIAARQIPLSMWLSWQEYWSELPFPPPEILTIIAYKKNKCLLNGDQVARESVPGQADGEGAVMNVDREMSSQGSALSCHHPPPTLSNSSPQPSIHLGTYVRKSGGAVNSARPSVPLTDIGTFCGEREREGWLLPAFPLETSFSYKTLNNLTKSIFILRQGSRKIGTLRHLVGM